MSGKNGSPVSGAPAPDPIGAAIDGAEATAQPGIRIAITLASGRPAVIGVPADITDSEVLSLISSVLEARDQLQRARQAAALVTSPALPGLRVMPS